MSLMKAQMVAALSESKKKRASRSVSSDVREEIVVACAPGPEPEVSEATPLSKVIEAKKSSKGKSSFARAIEFNKPERGWLVLGLLSAAANGGIYPVMALVLTRVISNFFSCLPIGSAYATVYNDNAACTDAHSSGCTDRFFYHDSKDSCYAVLRLKQDTYCIYLALLGVAAFLASFGQVISFGIMGEHLTRRLREATFSAMLRNEVGWFDLKENSVGAIISLLSRETAYVEGAVGTSLGLITQNIFLVIISLIIAFRDGWALTLICLCVTPVLMIFMKMEMQYM